MSILELEVLARRRAETAPRKTIVLNWLKLQRHRREEQEADLLERTAFAQMNCE